MTPTIPTMMLPTRATEATITDRPSANRFTISCDVASAEDVRGSIVEGDVIRTCASDGISDHEFLGPIVAISDLVLGNNGVVVSATITTEYSATLSRPGYTLWVPQDKLVFDSYPKLPYNPDISTPPDVVNETGGGYFYRTRLFEKGKLLLLDLGCMSEAIKDRVVEWYVTWLDGMMHELELVIDRTTSVYRCVFREPPEDFEEYEPCLYRAKLYFSVIEKLK